MRGFQNTRENNRSTQRNHNTPSQLLKGGQAGEGTVGDAGDGIVIKLSTLGRMRD